MIHGGFLIAFWAVLSVALLSKGGLFVARHEGDTIHLVDMVVRQAAGEWAHLDYMTPIGWLATAPLSLFVAAGWGFGMAMLAAQVLVGALLLPAIWWVGASRLSTGWAMLFGAICLSLVLALVHGEAQSAASTSMHYNRWAWAAAFLAIACVLLPPVNRQGEGADGLVIGLAVAAMALIKATYVVAFLPVIVLALLLERRWRALRVALVAGLAVVVVLTGLAGPRFWAAYASDLLSVTRSTARPQPGLDLASVIAAPAYLGASLAAVVAVVLLRQAGRAREGLLLLLLVPGFIYVSYQNFGNDPQWLLLLGVMLFALRPAPGTVNGLGWDMWQALSLTGCAVFMLTLSTAVNLAFSPFAHLSLSRAEYEPMFPRSAQHGDIHVLRLRNDRIVGSVVLSARIGAAADEGEEPAALLGETLPECTLTGGAVTRFDAIARDLEAAGFAGIAPFGADLLTSYWLFGDLRRLEGGAPWRYVGLPGIAAASHLLVPLCPQSRRARRAVLAEIGAAGYGLREVHRNGAYILLELQPPDMAPSAR